MTDVSQIVGRLREKGIFLHAKEGVIGYTGPIAKLADSDLSEIREHRVPILEHLTATGSSRAPGATTRPPQLPLSYAQAGFWFLEQIELAGSAYNVPLAMRLGGELDIDALHSAFDTLVRRHEILRTSFISVDGQPTQHISNEIGAILTVRDLLAEADPESAADQIVQEEARRIFNLTKAPLLRAVLVKISAQVHVLSVTMHHIVSDAWSIGIFAREIGELYNAAVNKRTPSLADLKLQYADFSLWQRGQAQDKTLDYQLAYWKQTLSDAPTFLDLPTDHPRPATARFLGAAVPIVFSKDLTEALSTLARKEGVTLYMVLLAGFKVLLSRWSGQHDLVVGSSIAGRTHRDLEDLIGCFVNTIAVRTSLEDDPTFTELVHQTKGKLVDAYAHQDVPFERVVAELLPERRFDRQPIVQVNFAFENTEHPSLSLTNLKITPLETKTTTARFDLTLHLVETSDGVSGIFEYATDLFERETISRLLAQLTRIYAQVAFNPDQRLSEIALLDEVERDALINGNNSSKSIYPRHACIHELFSQQAKLTPTAAAIIDGDRTISYSELEAHSNQLAHYLKDRGVGRDVIVGLCIGASWELIVALLAILKAGGAYLPLDPEYPTDRLAHILSDAKVKVIVTHTSTADRLPAHDATLIRLDGDWQQIETRDTTTPQHDAQPNSLAYVIYTSGSTGTPKGVMGTHRAIVNRVQWDPGTDSEVYIRKTTPNFIDMLWEVFMPLVRGQHLVMVPDTISKDPLQLISALAENKVTRLVLVPSLLKSLLDAGEDLAAKLPHLKYWECSGEPLSSSLANAFRGKLPNSELVNVYGTSEFWDATFYVVKSHQSRSVPIGRPISNMRAYVLNERGEPVPTGVTGELYIAGPGLARGYLDRPSLTAERFLPCPYGPAGDRMYRTGDLARWLSDGNLEFQGRVDHQVKVRGFRIELGEIESALASHPSVEQAVVVALDDDRGEPMLAAYVVGGGEAVPQIPDLRGHLAQRLPEYMVPAAYVIMDTFPLTPSGKIDRKALPKPDSGAFSHGEYEMPESDLEVALASVWEDLLGVSSIGRNDNFFELGGHSLLALQMVSRLRRLGLRLDVRALFENARLRELASCLTRT